MKKYFLTCLITVAMAVPCVTFAQEDNQEAEEPPDPHHVPRMGLELGTSLGYGFSWEQGHNSGFLTMPSLGLGVLEEHGGAMLRIGGGVMASKERVLNGEALLWLPHNVSEGADVFLALGPVVQWAGNARRLDVTAGAVIEGGCDWLLMWPWVRMRYSIRSRFTGSGADLGVTVGATFWSLPL